MGGKFAALVLLCILLGTGIASVCTQPVALTPQPEPGTRAIDPGLQVANNISVDTTWDITFSYVHVTNNIWVMENVTLTILQGVTIKFDAGTSLHVQGRVIADGAPFHNISFIPYAANPATGDWQGITIENSTGECIFDNVVIGYSEVGIACWGSDSKITNSTIKLTNYFGVLCGEGSRSLVRNNFINTSAWSGIICGNNSQALVERNFIKTCYYGIVCYDVADVLTNSIETCWIGILGWGNSTIAFNDMYRCRDGVQGFYASPKIENNTIRVSGGNGTRFIHSDAVVRNNTLVYNNVGMDIDYASRNILDNMVNNKVNGIEITDCFYVGERDIVIEDLYADSGWSAGYYGSLTAQGSVTLYDCRNVTLKDCTITNTMNSLYVTNSTFTIHNCTFDNALRSQVFLDANATGTSFNRSVNPDNVTINGLNCLFQTYDTLDVQVVDYYDVPIPDAMVVVRESLLELYNTTTGDDGKTGPMVVKDRTVSDAGVIGSPLSVQVYTDIYNFSPNPATGIYISQTGLVKFTDLGDIFPPGITANSVVDGDRAFPVDGVITIGFSEPMNRTSVENAFSITGNVTGNFTWEGNNVTFTPDNLEYQTYYTVVISTNAMDEWGNNLEDPVSFSFTTVGAPGTGGSTMLIAIVVIFAVAGIAGWLVLRRLK